MLKKRKALLLFTFILFLSLVASLIYWDQYFFIVEKVQFVSKNQTIRSEYERRALELAQYKLEQYKGKNIWHLDLDELAKNLLRDPRFFSVSLKRNFPNQITAIVETRDIVLLYQDRQGQFYPIAYDGTVLSATGLEEAPDVPLIHEERIVSHPERLKKLISVLEQVPLSGKISRQSISEVRWSDSEGLKVEIAKSDGGVVVLGEKEIALRAKRAETVINYLESQNQKWRVIDANFSKKVLVRLRKHS